MFPMQTSVAAENEASGEVKQDEWGTALSISEAHFLPDVAELTELADKIKEREGVVKDDLVNFVNGSATRVDI